MSGFAGTSASASSTSVVVKKAAARHPLHRVRAAARPAADARAGARAAPVAEDVLLLVIDPFPCLPPAQRWTYWELRTAWKK